MIINISIGYQPGDPLDFTASHRVYAVRHGYEYWQVTENLIKGALPTWSKHTAALTTVIDRPVMIIDTNGEILSDCPPFHELLDGNQGADIFMALGHSFRPNAGMIILRQGNGSAAFSLPCWTLA